MRWPFPHVWQFEAYGGGWVLRSCRRCHVEGIGACWWQRLFVPCRDRMNCSGHYRAGDKVLDQHGNEYKVTLADD